MHIYTYTQALVYLDTFIKPIVFAKDVAKKAKEKDPLDRMRTLLALLDNPQEKFQSVLVGGTSGKGSTAYLLSHILTTAGYNTGFFVKPHLQKINERIQLNDTVIADDEFVSLTTDIVGAVEKMKQLVIGAPSHFEILVAMAFLYFAKKQVDIAIVEVGLGGEFDATNTLFPVLSILTSVGLDHTEILGNTEREIATTKAKIIKKKGQQRQRVITGATQADVLSVIAAQCQQEESKLYVLNKDFTCTIKQEGKNGSIFDFQLGKAMYGDISLSLLGAFQVTNASLAIAAALALKEHKIIIAEEYIRNALRTAIFPGRFEKTRYMHGSKRMNVLLDGAHNQEKMHAFVSSLQKLYPSEKKIFLVAFKEDKNVSAMLQEIVPVADTIIATTFHAETYYVGYGPFPAEKIVAELEMLSFQGNVLIAANASDALQKAGEFDATAFLVVTGSMYFVGEMRSLL